MHSLFAVLFCWLPLAGLLLAVSGFLRVVVRVTEAHRRKKALCMALTLLILAGCLGVLGAEVYWYTRDPGILDQGVNAVWHALTGQDQPPWAASSELNGLDPEDPFANYGNDPYAVNLDDYPQDDGLDDGLNEDWDAEEDWDADFDDGELGGFEEDESGAEEPSQKALFDEMLNSKSAKGAVPAG